MLVIMSPANGCEWLVSCIITSIPCQHVRLCAPVGEAVGVHYAHKKIPKIDSGVECSVDSLV